MSLPEIVTYGIAYKGEASQHLRFVLFSYMEQKEGTEIMNIHNTLKLENPLM